MDRVSFRSAVPAWLSGRARKAFQLANQEAHRLGHPVVGTEHLLLGLAKESLSPGAWALRFCGYDLFWLRRQVEREQPPDFAVEPLRGALPYAEDLAGYLQRIAPSSEAATRPVTTQQVLAGLMRKPESKARGILRRRWLSWWLMCWLLRRTAELDAAADTPA
jgi:ATP-dependent Clp protease ATP-binding subunit ClpC